MNELINDKNCTWINDLKPRTNIKILSKNENCDWLVVGAGYTGLSAARKLGQLNPNQKIMIGLSLEQDIRDYLQQEN